MFLHAGNGNFSDIGIMILITFHPYVESKIKLSVCLVSPREGM